MKSLMLLLGACVIILLMAAVGAAIQDFRSEDFPEQHGNVTTAAGVTTANITLTQDLFGDRTSEITSITSSLGTDVPLATTYTASSNKLLVTGLAASGSRTLTIVYKIGVLADYWAADLGARAWMMFLILGIIGVIAASVYVAMRRD